MRALWAFYKKEQRELYRTGKLPLLLLIFLLFGVMNPAIAKITPWLLTFMAESLAEAGLTVATVSVDALTSWTQFFKNVPLALIALCVVLSSIFTYEYQQGTLIPLMVRGLTPWKIAAAKGLSLLLIWTAGYWLCFAVTYGYNAYFWDNGIAASLGFSAGGYWLMGVWVLSLMGLFSALAGSQSQVLLGTGAAFCLAYLASLLPELKPYTPAYLADPALLLTAQAAPASFLPACWITLGLTVLNGGIALAAFRRKRV